MMSSPHVLIIGACLAGLTLAQSLRKQGITYDIFERDTAIDARAGGWAIATHTILRRLEKTLPSDVPDLHMVNHLCPLSSASTADRRRPSCSRLRRTLSSEPIANRQQLRRLLSSNVNVHWGAEFEKIEELADGVRVVLADGSSYSGDILVGADGVQSKVRSCILPHATPETLPAGVINGELRLTGDAFHRQLALGNSAYVAGAEGFHLYVGLSSVSPDAAGGYYYWFLNFYDAAAVNEPYWTANASKRQMLDYAREKTNALHPAFAEIIRDTPVDGIRSPPIVFRDLLIERLPEGRITLIGGAAHPMAPFRGEGGSNALEDALNLADIIGRTSKKELVSALKEYEEEMLPRGRAAVSRSRAVLDPENGARLSFAWGQDFKWEDLSQYLLSASL